MSTILGKVVPFLNPEDSLMISMRSRDNLKYYILNLVRLMATILGSVVISGRRFRMQKLKLRPTSCFSFL